MIPRVPHDFMHDLSLAASSSFYVCHSLLFTKGKNKQKKSIILTHFSNLKFLFGLINYMTFITADFLNSAAFDSISFCKKFESNF